MAFTLDVAPPCGSLVAFPVANIAWGEKSMSVGDRNGELVAIGDFTEAFVTRLPAEAARFPLNPIIERWTKQLEERYADAPPPVIFYAPNSGEGHAWNRYGHD
jgi:hypothetical protein